MIDVAMGCLPALRPDQDYGLTRLAELASVSHKTVSRWRITGIRPADGGERVRLPAYRVGGTWRVMGADVIGWLRAIQPAAEAAPAVRVAARQQLDVDRTLDALGF